MNNYGNYGNRRYTNGNCGNQNQPSRVTNDCGCPQTKPAKPDCNCPQTKPTVPDCGCQQTKPAVPDCNCPQTKPAVPECNCPQTKPAVPDCCCEPVDCGCPETGVMGATDCGCIIGTEGGYSKNCETDMPGFAIAMAYVPWQAWKELYEICEGHQNGTIFKQLDLDFLGRRCN